mgnify:CR=1 FL=1
MERTGNITFSVIVPVYNVQAYLSACVKSVVEQAGPADWECILVDDGSTDACPAMCDAFAQLCPGVTVIHRSNGGLAAARNTGIKAAKGKWLLFLDSDDYWPPHMLEKLRTALAAAPADTFVIGGASVYRQTLAYCDTAYVTQIHRAFPAADCYFPNLAADPAWEAVETEGPYRYENLAYTYVTYRRR